MKSAYGKLFRLNILISHHCIFSILFSFYQLTQIPVCIVLKRTAWDITSYPMLRADSRFRLVNNREYGAVSHIWRHQREIWKQRNVIDDVTMAIPTAVRFPYRYGTT